MAYMKGDVIEELKDLKIPLAPWMTSGTYNSRILYAYTFATDWICIIVTVLRMSTCKVRGGNSGQSVIPDTFSYDTF